MLDLDIEELIQIANNEDEILRLYGDYVKDEKERISLEIKLEQLAESILHKLDESFVSDMDYSDESLETLEGLIDSAFQNAEKEEIDFELVEQVAIDLGSYFALTTIKSIGGEWRFRKDLIHSSIYFGSIEKECFPFHKLIKRLINGKEESICVFYTDLLDSMGVID